jgi:hypothetical protein
LDWRAATAVGANNGGVTFWIDGLQQVDLTTVDNDTRRVDRARLGALTGIDAGTSGTYYFDAFESRRQTYIGPVSTGPTATPSSTPIPTFTPTLGPSSTPTFTPTVGPSSTPTLTPTPTATSALPDAIFADGFESGNLSAWTSNANDLGDLGASPASALVGSQGLQALIDDTVSIYVNDDTPNAEMRYRARFYFDPNSITMASGDAHFIFKGFIGTATDVLQVEFRSSAGAYQLRAKLLNDSAAFVVTNWFTITDAPHAIELDWRAATAVGANNGGLTFWIDNVQQADLTGVDNDVERIDRVRLGALAGMDVGTSGTYFFDAFESRRQTFIGP